MELVPWITLGAVALAVTLFAAVQPNVLNSIWRTFDRVASRRIIAPILVALIALALGIAPILAGHAPIPSVHDEFANLLAADTFVRGRLANRTPDLPEHFETVHELMSPTYASKFPPGEGLTLAAGKLLGCASLGAVATIALGCAAIVVALRCWMPPRWATLGGLLAATHPMIFQWGQSFWGGGVAMLGGAVLLAGAGHVAMPSNLDRRRADRVAGIVIGTGLAILAISRPFEGLITATIVGSFLIARCVRLGAIVPLLTRVVPGALVVLLPAGAWLGYYNHRVTGDWSRLPWVEYASRYMTTPIFLGHDRAGGAASREEVFRDVVFRNDKMRQFHAGYEQQEYRQALEHGYAGRIASAAREVWESWIRPTTIAMLAPAAVIVLVTSRRRRQHDRANSKEDDQPARGEKWGQTPIISAGAIRAADSGRWPAGASGIWLGAATFVGLFLLHPALTPWMRPQYLAPATAGFVLWIVASLRHVSRPAARQASRWSRFGAALSAGIVAAQIASGVVTSAHFATRDRPPGIRRDEIMRDLDSRPGRKLLLVRYTESPQLIFEWVYNDAEIEAQRTIVARSLGAESDARLMAQHADRDVWLLHVDGARVDGPIAMPRR